MTNKKRSWRWVGGLATGILVVALWNLVSSNLWLTIPEERTVATIPDQAAVPQAVGAKATESATGEVKVADGEGASAPESNEQLIIKAFARAETAMDAGDFEAARQAWEDVLALDSNHVAALAELGFLYSSMLDDAEKAEIYLSQALELDPRNHEVAFELGELLSQRGNVERGKALFARLLEAHPDSETLNYAYAELLSSTGDKAAAIEHLEKVAEVSEDRARALRDLASAYVEAGRAADAVTLYRRLEEQLQSELAVESGPRADAIRDDFARTRLALAQALILSGAMTEAEQVLRSVEQDGRLAENIAELRALMVTRKRSG